MPGGYHVPTSGLMSATQLSSVPLEEQQLVPLWVPLALPVSGPLVVPLAVP